MGGPWVVSALLEFSWKCENQLLCGVGLSVCTWVCDHRLHTHLQLWAGTTKLFLLLFDLVFWCIPVANRPRPHGAGRVSYVTACRRSVLRGLCSQDYGAGRGPARPAAHSPFLGLIAFIPLA